MRTIESMKSEKQKISQNIEKLRNRERELEKNIEQASMREIWEESIKHGVTTAADLRKLFENVAKENKSILAGGNNNGI